MPDDPDSNMVANSSSTQFTTTNSVEDPLKLKQFKDLKAPASINLPPLKPLEPAESDVIISNGSSNGNGNGKDGSVVTRKIKACPELPPGKNFWNLIAIFAIYECNKIQF